MVPRRAVSDLPRVQIILVGTPIPYTPSFLCLSQESSRRASASLGDVFTLDVPVQFTHDPMF